MIETAMPGHLYWITGLSGTGKTTLAKVLSQRLKSRGQAVVMLDGDELRKAYGISGHHDYHNRKKVAMSHARCCHLLVSQGVDVVCSTISLFGKVHNWLNDHIERLTIIHLSADEVVRQKRQAQKCLIQAELMVGQGVHAEYPLNPHVELVNNGDLSPQQLCDQLEFYLQQRVNRYTKS